MYFPSITKSWQKTLITCLIFSLIGFILTVPAFISDYVAGHDSAGHFKWSKYFIEQFLMGDYYPRWLHGMHHGLGSPVFFYYMPMPYMTMGLIAKFCFADLSTWKIIGLSAMFALTCSGIFTFLWLKEIFEPISAFWGALIFMVLPYHLFIDLYVRFAFAEFWAFVWPPLLLLFTQRISRRDNLSLVGVSVIYAFLIMTHLPTTLIFSPILIAYGLTVNCEKRLQDLLLLLLALLLGVGISSIYLLPAMTLQDLVLIGQMGKLKNFFFNHFFNFNGLLSNVVFTRIITLSTIYFIVTLTLAWYLARPQKCRQKLECRFWLTTSLCAFFMFLPASSFFWETLPLIHKVQFPFRFSMLLVISFTVLFTAAIISIKQSSLFRFGVFTLLCVILALSTIFTSFYVRYLSTAKVLEVKHTQQSLDESLEQSEYRSKWTSQEFYDDPFISKSLQENRYEIIENSGSLEILEWKPRKISIKVSSEQGCLVMIRQFYFPAWEATIHAGTQNLEIYPSTPEGLILIKVPSGVFDVDLRLKRLWQERLGIYITIISMGLLICIWGLSYYKKGCYRHSGPF